MNKSNFVIINGFDRSGSSAISRTLSKHPGVELIMQPFNSGFIRKGKYRALEKNEHLDTAKTFFNGLSNNFLNNDLIESRWHLGHSTTLEYIPGKLHIIKTTMNHLAQRFMNDHYPMIDVWGIWRDPYEIIHSIKNNNFDDVWYKEALPIMKTTVAEEPVLREIFLPFFSQTLNRNQELALVVAISSYFFFYYLNEDKLLSYHSFREDPNRAFNAFSNIYSLKDFDFNKDHTVDMNITGKSFSENSDRRLDQKTIHEIEPIIQPLLELFNSKFKK